MSAAPFGDMLRILAWDAGGAACTLDKEEEVLGFAISTVNLGLVSQTLLKVSRNET